MNNQPEVHFARSSASSLISRADAKDVAYLKLLSSIFQRPFADVVAAVSGKSQLGETRRA